jgi:oligopeptide/dipeptide ABC transporter ATP-binding protein
VSVLSASELSVQYRAGARVLDAVRHVSLEVRAGERFGIIGESGSGKSSLLRALLGLTPLASGTATFEGTPMHGAPRTLRRRIQPVFQDVGAALDPRMRIREVLAEPFAIHALACDEAKLRALLDAVQLGPELLERLPRELSVGQRQRVNLARALALDPAMLLLDEPVSALDVSVQAQVINLLLELARARGLAFVVITHDLDVVAHLAERLAVMFAGRFVEVGPTAAVLSAPRHPYTRLLVESRTRAVEASTTAPSLTGCPFAPRCAEASEACRAAVPPLTGAAHQSACLLHPGA